MFLFTEFSKKNFLEFIEGSTINNLEKKNNFKKSGSSDPTLVHHRALFFCQNKKKFPQNFSSVAI